MIEGQGVAYAAYLRLRVARLTDDLTEVIAKQAGFTLDSDEFLAIRYIIRQWRNGKYTYYAGLRGQHDQSPDKRELYTRFIIDFDLGFHLRRLSFVLAKIDQVLMAGEDADAICDRCRIDPNDGDVRKELRWLRGQFSQQRKAIVGLRAELMTPGQIYRFEVDMSATAQTFKAGHRIRLQVTSSDFPMFEPNLNTGGPFASEVKGQVAHNTVFHDSTRPSHVVLPVMERQ